MNAPDEPSTQTASESFLLAEFQAVLDRSLKFEEVKANRINFYLLLFAATTAGFAGVLNVSFVQENIYPIGLGLALFLGVLGWQSLMHSVQYSMAIISLYRVSGRTRRWFYEKNPELFSYLAFEPADNKPGLLIGNLAKKGMSWQVRSLLWRGGEPILLSINAVLGGLILCISLMWGLEYSSLSFEYRGLLGLLAMGIGILFFWAFQVNRIKSILSQRNNNILKREHFPMSREEYKSLQAKYQINRNPGEGEDDES